MSLRARFEALSEFLRQHRALWMPRPFVLRTLPWEEAHADVAAWLNAQNAQTLHAIDVAPTEHLGSAPVAFAEWARAAAALTQVEAISRPGGQPPLPPSVVRPGLSRPRSSSPQPDDHAAATRPRAQLRVPARKSEQVVAFVSAVKPHLPRGAERVVDWCSGKGHLGRAVRAGTELEVDLLEWRPDLCAAGEALHADVSGMRFHEVDVLEHGRDHLGPDAAGLALHACGILWRTLLADAAATGAFAAVAPCCYHHLGGEPRYAPLSIAGRAAGLELMQPHLRLAVAEERVARPAILTARRREQGWRLGLDLLLREALGEDRYVEQGPLPKAMFDLPFADFCLEAAERLGRALPQAWSAVAAQEAGEARAHQVFALGQVRSLFRRPLELWLVLDAAVAQEEQGRTVQLGTFCNASLTPRNLMLVTGVRPTRLDRLAHSPS